MGYAVILSLKAVGDLEAIVRYISLTNSSAARKVGQSLLEKTKELSQLPFKGQKVPEFDSPNIRQLVLKPYRIVYRVEENKSSSALLAFGIHLRGTSSFRVLVHPPYNNRVAADGTEFVCRMQRLLAAAEHDRLVRLESQS